MEKNIIFLLIFFTFSTCDKNENPLNGQKAYDFVLKDVSEQSKKLSDFKNQKIILHFWADWCASCREEFFTLQNIYDLLIQQNATIIGINVGQSKEHVKELIDEYGVTFTMLRDKSNEISKEYNVHGLPMNYFLTTSGIIYKIIPGWMDKEKILAIMKDMD
jgi:peroxiredoxin